MLDKLVTKLKSYAEGSVATEPQREPEHVTPEPARPKKRKRDADEDSESVLPVVSVSGSSINKTVYNWLFSGSSQEVGMLRTQVSQLQDQLVLQQKQIEALQAENEALKKEKLSSPATTKSPKKPKGSESSPRPPAGIPTQGLEPSPPSSPTPKRTNVNPKTSQ